MGVPPSGGTGRKGSGSIGRLAGPAAPPASVGGTVVGWPQGRYTGRSSAFRKVTLGRCGTPTGQRLRSKLSRGSTYFGVVFVLPATGCAVADGYYRSMPYPDRLLTDGESVVREFRSHWRLLVIPLFMALVAIGVMIATWFVWPDNRIADLVITGIALLALAVWGLWPFIQWWFRTYVLTSERLITRSGVIARQGFEMPLESINDIKFSQNILERMLHSGDLLIESAGEEGQSRFHDIPEPEEFQSLLYKVREQRTGKRAAEAAIDPAAQLEALTRLHREGVLTDEEFEEKRQKLVDRL